MIELIEKYKEVCKGDPVPLYQIQGDKIFSEKFGESLIALYNYCIENKVKWEDVLQYKENPESLY